MEPERPIENLLRAYAKRQRESAGPPLELHPATRRLLQGEVVRQFGVQRAERPAWFGRRLFWAWGLAVLAALGVVTAFLISPVNRAGRQQLLADSRRSEPARFEEAVPLPESRPVREPSAHAVPSETAPAPATPAPAKPALPPGLRENLNVASQADSGTTLSLANRRMTPAAPAPAAQAQDKLKALAKAPGPEVPVAAPGAGYGGGGGPVPPTSSAIGGSMPSPGLAGGPALSLASRDALPAPTTPATVAPPINVPVGESSLASTAGVMFQEKAENNQGAATRGYKSPTTGSESKSSISDRAVVSAPTARAPAAGASSAQPIGNSAYRFLGEFAASTTVDKDTYTAQPAVRSRLAGARQDRSSLDESSPRPAPVLVNFKLEQAGRLLRITDSDGSVYAGFLQLTNGSSPLVAGRTARSSTMSGALQSPKTIAQKSAPALGTTQQFFFRVAGTNRSLSRPVVFTGNLVRITNSAAPQKARLSGKAVVGGAQELSIDAVSQKP